MKVFSIIVFALILIAPSISFAHPQTERYIPIGQSPGQQVSFIGEISATSEDDITVSGKRIAVPEGTPIWIDGSRHGHKSRVGDRSDCTLGRFVEIHFHTVEGKRVANWVKVRAE